MSRKSREQTDWGKRSAVPLRVSVPASRRWPESWQALGVCIFLAAIIWLVFGQTLRFGFVNFDDDDYVYQNVIVQKGLTFPGVIWAFTHFHASNWHPLTWLSHMLDCQLYGLNAGGHHLTNVLLHTVTVILLFLVLRRMTGFLWRSAFVAAVFAIHPLRVESVAWVAERKDVLSGLFFVLTIGAYVRYASHPWSPGRYGLVVLCFALGLMCKPMLVTLPVVLLLLDYWPLNRLATNAGTEPVFQLAGRKIPKRLVIEKLPLLGLTAASCVITVFAQTKAIQPLEKLSLSLRAGNALISYMAYLGQTLWPAGLAVLYPFKAASVNGANVTLSLVALAGISLGVFVLRRDRPYFLTGWLWYLIMLVPVIGIVQVGVQGRADRYTYLPQIGLELLLTWAMADICAAWRYRRAALSSFAAVILVILIGCARVQASYWRNSETLWTHTLACTSDNAEAHNNLGVVLFQKGDVDEAIVQYQKALEIHPGYADAHNNFGNALFQQGKVEDAMAEYQKALQINPNLAKAYYNRGAALFQQDKVDEAIVQYRKAVQINHEDSEANNNLGNALLHQGKADEAIAYFQKALQIQPDFTEARYNLGTALLQQGNAGEAVAQYQKVLQLKPDYAEAHNNLGNALFEEGNVDGAIGQYQEALQLKPDYAEACYNLGNVFGQKGNLDEATVYYQKALQIHPNYVQALNNLAWILATRPQAAQRSGKQAVELARRANQLTRDNNPIVLGTLAAAYAENGRFPEAVEAARHALKLAETQSNSNLANAIRSQLKLYEAGLPLHSK